MAHGIKKSIIHIINSLQSEGLLKNALVEIKDVKPKLKSLVDQHLVATYEATKWADKQDDVICELLSSIQELEVQLGQGLSAYIKDYHKFQGFWQNILTERTGFKDIMESHKKILEKIQHTEMEVQRVEAIMKKNPSPSIDSEYVSLKTQLGEQYHVRTQVYQKMVAVLRDVHTSLRKGYFNLADSRMQLFHSGAILQEKIMKLIKDFPQLDSVEDSGTMTYKAFARQDSLSMTDPIWHQGDEITAQLERERAAHKNAVEALRNQHEQEIANLQTKQAKDLEELHKSFLNNQALLDEEMSREMSDADSKIKYLEAKVMNLVSEKDVLNQEVSLLQNLVEKLSFNSVRNTIADTAEVSHEDPPVVLLLKANNALSKLKALESAPTSSDFVLGSVDLSRDVNTAVAAAMAVAQIFPEHSFKILEQAQILTTESLSFFAQAAERFLKYSDGQRITAEDSKALQTALEAISSFMDALLADSGLPADIKQDMQTVSQLVDIMNRLLDELEQECNSLTEPQKSIRLRVVRSARDVVLQLKTVLDSAASMKEELSVCYGKNASEAEIALIRRQWLSGLQTSLHHVIEYTPMWMQLVQSVIRSHENFEECHVETRNIAACSAQLTAWCRTKVPPSSNQKFGVETASEKLISISHRLISALREAQLLELAGVGDDEKNIAQMQETQAKALIMAARVNILKLENELDHERVKLGRLRRKLYGDLKVLERDAIDEDDADLQKRKSAINLGVSPMPSPPTARKAASKTELSPPKTSS